MCTVGLYVSLCLMIFFCPFLHCKALRTAMYKRYINSIIIIISSKSSKADFTVGNEIIVVTNTSEGTTFLLQGPLKIQNCFHN